tara:strand:+ start:252 stop:611 length:360 start_codon:yes stop_codon:yes gene_type:complete
MPELNSELIEHYRIVGDTSTPLGIICERADGTVVDVTGLTITFSMVSDAGVTIIDGAAGAINDATAGKVTYDFAAADVDTAGVFWGYFHVATSGELETFPPDGRKLMIVISNLGKEAGT